MFKSMGDADPKALGFPGHFGDSFTPLLHQDPSDPPEKLLSLV